MGPTTIHNPAVLNPAGTGGHSGGLDIRAIAAVLAAMGGMTGGLPVAEAVETKPPAQRGQGRDCHDPCMRRRRCDDLGHGLRELCTPNARVMVEQLNRLLRPQVPGYPDCATFDPYAPTDSVLGQTLAEFRATLAAAKRYFETEAPAPAEEESTDDQLASIAASLANLTASVAGIQATVAAVQGDVTAVQASVTDLDADLTTVQTGVTGVQASVTAVETSVAAIEADIDTIQTDVADIQGRVTVLEAAP